MAGAGRGPRAAFRCLPPPRPWPVRGDSSGSRRKLSGLRGVARDRWSSRGAVSVNFFSAPHLRWEECVRISGNGVVVRGITLTGARSADYIGAGIRPRASASRGTRALPALRDRHPACRRTGAARDRARQPLRRLRELRACLRAWDLCRAARTAPRERSRFVATREGRHGSRALRDRILDRESRRAGRDGVLLIDVPNGGAVMLRGNRLGRPAFGQPQHRDHLRRRGRRSHVRRTFPHRINTSPSRALSLVFVTNYTATTGAPVRNTSTTVRRCAAMAGLYSPRLELSNGCLTRNNLMLRESLIGARCERDIRSSQASHIEGFLPQGDTSSRVAGAPHGGPGRAIAAFPGGTA